MDLLIASAASLLLVSCVFLLLENTSHTSIIDFFGVLELP